MIFLIVGIVFYVFCMNGEDYSCSKKCFYCMFCVYLFVVIKWKNFVIYICVSKEDYESKLCNICYIVYIVYNE